MFKLEIARGKTLFWINTDLKKSIFLIGQQLRFRLRSIKKYLLNLRDLFIISQSLVSIFYFLSVYLVMKT